MTKKYYIINDKFIKEEIALQMPKKKKESKGQLAQIVRRKNSTKVKPSGKIYKRNKKIEDDQNFNFYFLFYFF